MSCTGRGLMGGDRTRPPDSLISQAHVWLHDAAVHADKEAPGIAVLKEVLVGSAAVPWLPPRAFT
jgi:hypothetical protein